MRVSGFVMTDESGEVLAVSVGGSADLAKSLAAGKAAPESPAELAAEHKRLVDVLRSPDHNDDLAEADRQEGELAEYREQACEEMSKSHVKGYTRKDGTFVKEHDDNRQAAQPKPTANHIMSRHQDKLVSKGEDWKSDGKKIPAGDVAHFPEYSHKEVYGTDDETSPAGDNFDRNFVEKHRPADNSGFVVRHNDGKRFYVDTQGYDYARYHAPVEDAPAGGGRVNSDDAFEQITAAGGKDVSTTSGHINYTHNGQQKQLAHTDASDGQRYVDPAELKQHLSDLKAGGEKSGAAYDHPNVVGKVGKMTSYDWSKESGTKAVDHNGAVKDAMELEFAGAKYTPTGKSGKSLHDETPVHEAESEDGHRIWVDDAGRVHADSQSEVAGLRKKFEEHSASSAKPAEKKAAPKAKESGADGDEIAKVKARITAARNGMYAAGKNKAEYERHEMAFEDAIDKLDKLQSAKSAPSAEKSPASAQSDSNESGWDKLPDEENPRHALSLIGSGSLGAVARGEDDLNKRAKVELAARGLDSDAKWVGFKDAAKHHGVEVPKGDPDEVGGHMQLMHSAVLGAAARGELDLNKQAKHTLASRGHDSNGAWVGFDAAKKHHGIAAPAKPKGKPMAKALLFVPVGGAAELLDMNKAVRGEGWED